MKTISKLSEEYIKSRASAFAINLFIEENIPLKTTRSGSEIVTNETVIGLLENSDQRKLKG